jgi:hypothetical protein
MLQASHARSSTVDDFTLNHMDQENWLYAVEIVRTSLFPRELNPTGER